MALEEYRRKRDFSKTPEPAGKARSKRGAAKRAGLSYLIQKHAARRLHYDFRLELDGVLKSWAVPKGPSLDPGEKRLAVHTEDHPMEYGTFEGVIPEGEYGGGTVMLWDRGTWEPDSDDPAESYRRGTLKFRLHGEKLQGRWMLVRMGGKAAREKHENWLLVKERDETAVPGSGDAVVEDNPLSVVSGRDIDAIATDRDEVWRSNRGEAKRADGPDPSALSGARKAKLPDFIEPQLATLADKAPAGDEWVHEIKYDGYRILARIAGGKVRLLTRSGLDWTDKFPQLAHNLSRLPVATAFIDGELVFIEDSGSTSFSSLQNALSEGDVSGLVYYAFDLMHLDGYDLARAPLVARKSALAALLGERKEGMLRYSDHIVGEGKAFFERACSYALEGIVSKRGDCPYRAGRGRAWLKIKCVNREEFVIVGYTDPAGSRTGFGALVLGYYDPKGVLNYAGRVGTGFNEKTLAMLKRRLAGVKQSTKTVKLPAGVSARGTHWVRPELVAEIQFAGWTADRILRHAAFLGLREDKPAREVIVDSAKLKASAAPAEAEPAIAKDGSTSIEGVRITNALRVLYPEQGTTKLDLARYYIAVADWMLPHLQRRPLSLVRCPEGRGKSCFYQKHLSAGVPDQLRRIEIAEKSGKDIYLYVEDLQGLLALVQMGVLEIHPWGSTTKDIERPDRLIFDFDPDEGLPWQRMIDASIGMRDLLAEMGLQSFAKTTGGKGLHVVVPMTPKVEWDEAKAFTKWVAETVAAAAPGQFTTNMAKRARTGKIFIDYLRNGRGATAIAAYSARARENAPVSAPLFWDEVENGVRSDQFTIANLPQRLQTLKSDPWAEMKGMRQTIPASVRRKLVF